MYFILSRLNFLRQGRVSRSREEPDHQLFTDHGLPSTDSHLLFDMFTSNIKLFVNSLPIGTLSESQ